MATGKRFLNPKEETLLANKIASIERKSTAEIRIHVSTRPLNGDALEEAKSAFTRLGMEKTKQRNGVLIFVALQSRKLAIFGDEGIHRLIHDEGWMKYVDTVLSHFKKDDYFIGLNWLLEQLEKTLAENFPADGSDNPNELPDEISRD